MTRKELFDALCKEIEGGDICNDISVSKGLTENTLTVLLCDGEVELVLGFSEDEFSMNVYFMQ